MAQMNGNEKYLLDINKDNLSRAIAFVGTYDDKAKFVLTIILALTAYLVTELPTYVDRHAKHSSDAWFVLLDLFAIGCLGCFVYAAILVVLIIRPNLDQHTQKRSPFFFQSIAATPCDEFRQTMTTLPASQAIEMLAEQTYDNAKVIMKKHSRLRNAVTWFFCGMLCFFVFTIGRATLLALTS